MRSETYLNILAEKFLCKNLKSTLKVAHCNSLVNNKSFKLMEYRRMSSINLVCTVNSTGAYHSYGKLALFHCSYLNRRSLCTKKNISVYIECILFILCWMVCRNIKCLKVVIIKLNLGTFNHFIAHADENIADLINYSAHGVLMTALAFFAGHRNVKLFLYKLVFLIFFFKNLLCLIHFLFDFESYLVCQLTDNRSFFCRKLTHTFKYACKLTFFAETFNLEFINILALLSIFNAFHSLFVNFVKLFLH
ncbi:hypothetical protein SDC9_155631 [bioreactor metagenome]|uniref:Uncharacterized protein n=1 Tax=bioreactor metagenome TaxID=1076179 RepID=A0A645F4J2_9ZZZZ